MQLIESGLIHYYIEPGKIKKVDRSVTAQPDDRQVVKKKGLMTSHDKRRK